MTKDLSPLLVRSTDAQFAAIDAKIMADIETDNAELLGDLRAMEPTQHEEEEVGLVLTTGIISLLVFVLSIFFYSTYLLFTPFY